MTILLLGGTAEAQMVAEQLAAEDIPSVISLAGATKAPQAQALPTRIGGFGSAEGFKSYIRDAGISAVLDATHPFAERIATRSAEVCAQIAMPYCKLLRAPWRCTDADQWTSVERASDAARVIGPQETVFLATGRQSLDAFANLEGRTVYLRQIDPPDRPFPFSKGGYVIARPPFTEENEIALFQDLKIDWLVSKNAGGIASFPKLLAARALGLRVVMVERPAPPDALCVSTVNEALHWARTQ